MNFQRRDAIRAHHTEVSEDYPAYGTRLCTCGEHYPCEMLEVLDELERSILRECRCDNG